MKPFSILAFAAAGIGAACAPPGGDQMSGTGMAVDTAAALAGIDSTRVRYEALQMAGDAAGVAGLYHEDATLDLYGVPRTKGRANIEAAFRANYGMRKYPLTEITPINTSVRTNEDASQIGTYHDMHDVNGAVDHEWGRFVVGLRKGADGVWRLTYLMGFPDSTKAGK